MDQAEVILRNMKIVTEPRTSKAVAEQEHARHGVRRMRIGNSTYGAIVGVTRRSGHNKSPAFLWYHMDRI
jgi:hypothetical protein